MNSPRNWTTEQLVATLLFAVIELVAGIIYLPAIWGGLINAERLCTTTSLKDELTPLISPDNWLGIFSAVLFVIAIHVLLKNVRSKYPEFAKLQKYFFVLIIAIVLLSVNRFC